MPLVHRDESPTTGLCARARAVHPACGESVCRGKAPPPLARSTLQPQRPQELLCLCVPTTQCVVSVCHPAPHPRKQQTLGGWTDRPSSWRPSSVSAEAFFPGQMVRWPCARTWFMQWHRVGSWKPQAEMTVQSKNELGSWQLKCS